MIKIHIDELNTAVSWYLRVITQEQRYAISKSMRSVERLGIDGNKVLIAAYRLWLRHNSLL